VSYETVISTAEFANDRDPSWVIADCRYDLHSESWGRQQYGDGHIPGAVYVSLAKDLSSPPTGTNGRHPLPTFDAMVDAFSRLGIRNDVQVVAYDQDSGMFASRLWWMLRYAGHPQVAVLDGGWHKWLAEERPHRAGNEQRAATIFTPHWQRAWHLDVDEVAAIQPEAQSLLLDARAPERFEGRVEPLDRLPGHIPGAVNHPYRTNLTADNTLLPPTVLREQFERDLQGRSPAQAVMYCGSGVSACHNLLAMEHAGLRGARLYVGSWSEWSADPQRPVETGPSRR
jgi:thiosulfate/3-mercaptopyruvate sulfurtransferase